YFLIFFFILSFLSNFARRQQGRGRSSGCGGCLWAILGSMRRGGCGWGGGGLGGGGFGGGGGGGFGGFGGGGGFSGGGGGSSWLAAIMATMTLDDLVTHARAADGP